MLLTEGGHRLKARVYYADTDFSGVVYHARYLEFLERGRSDYLRLAGVHHTELAGGSLGERSSGWSSAWRSTSARPARIDDILTIDTRTGEHFGRPHLHGAATPGAARDLLVDARVEAAIIGENGRPRRFPREWMAAFLPAD